MKAINIPGNRTEVENLFLLNTIIQEIRYDTILFAGTMTTQLVSTISSDSNISKKDIFIILTNELLLLYEKDNSVDIYQKVDSFNMGDFQINITKTVDYISLELYEQEDDSKTIICLFKNETYLQNVAEIKKVIEQKAAQGAPA